MTGQIDCRRTQRDKTIYPLSKVYREAPTTTQRCTELNYQGHGLLCTCVVHYCYSVRILDSAYRMTFWIAVRRFWASKCH